MATVKRIAGDYRIQTTQAGDSVLIETTDITMDASAVNITGDLTVVGNAVLTGNIAADKIFYGTSNVTIPALNGNVIIGVGGTPNIATFSTQGQDVTGYMIATGNVVGANVNTAGLITATGNITGANINTAGNVWISRDASIGQPTIRFTDTDTDITDGQVFGALEWYTNDASSTGPRVTAGIRTVAAGVLGNANVQILTSTNGSAATVKVTVLSTGNVGIANAAPNDTLAVSGSIYGSSTLSIVGNVQGGNLRTVGLASVTGNITTGANVITAGYTTVTGNITGGNLITAGVISAGAAGVSAIGNITGGNLNIDSAISAVGNITGDVFFMSRANVTSNVNTGNLNVSSNAAITNTVTTPNIVVSTSMTGSGIGVENFVYQSSDFALSSATPETIGVLQFDAVANRAYRFYAYVDLVPEGSTTISPAVSFSAGTCLYTTQIQTTSTSAFSVATKNSSDNVTTTYSSTGTDNRTLIISGIFYHTVDTTVAMRFQTSAANIAVKTGSYLSYTRIN